MQCNGDIYPRDKGPSFSFLHTTLQPYIMKCLSCTTSYLWDFGLFMYIGNLRQICLMFYQDPFFSTSSAYNKSIHSGKTFLYEIYLSIIFYQLFFQISLAKCFFAFNRFCLHLISNCCIIHMESIAGPQCKSFVDIFLLMYCFALNRILSQLVYSPFGTIVLLMMFILVI